MQFDQRTIIRLIAIAVILVGGLVQWLRSSVQQESPSVPASPTSSDTAGNIHMPQFPSPSGGAVVPPSAGTSSDAAAPTATRGDFDYYLLVLSWSPTHCETARSPEDDTQCHSPRPFGFVLHGLWPQNERGYPEGCSSDQPRGVSSQNMTRMLEVSPSERLVQHEWEKHGTCSGLSQSDFVSTAISAYRRVTVPQDFRALAEPLRTTPDDVRDAFLQANSDLTREDLAATCSRNELAEVWICLDKSLHPRACSQEVRKRHCGGRRVRMPAMRGGNE